MKILFYNHTGHVSGAERVLMMILRGLDRGVYEPVVLCPPASKMMELASSANVETRSLDQLEARFTWRPDRVARYLRSFATVIKDARNLVKKERPAVIHANSIRAGMVMAAATIGLKVPVVWHAHDILPRHPLSTLVRLLALITFPNHVLAVSRAVASGFRGILLRPFTRRVPITVIHNAVDLDRFHPGTLPKSEVRRQLDLPPDEPVVGILLIVGETVFSHDEEYARQLRGAVNSLGLTDRVRFLGARDDIPKLLQALDVLVVNSHQEPFALTVLEGLASGTAVLATSVGGTPEMVRHDQNGWLVQSGNQDELSAGLITLMNDTDLRARLGSLARHDATAQYSTSRFLTEVNSLYREILNDCHIPQQKNLPNLEVSLSSD